MSSCNHSVKLCVITISLLTAACTVLPAQKETTQLYILTPATSAVSDSSRAANNRALAIGLGPISFPGYLKQREIVTRKGGGELELSENKRWGEPLDANFQSVLSQDLGAQLGTQRIILFPWYGRPQLDYRVEVQVHRFDTDADNRSRLDARWIIKNGKTGQELFANESNISSTVATNDEAGSEALSQDVNTLSVALAQEIVSLSEGSGTTAELPKSSGARLSRR
jgi:uncharacterized protein